MTTTHDPIDFICGDRWSITGSLGDQDGNPLNMSTVLDIIWKLDSLDNTKNALTLSFSEGGINILDEVNAIIEVAPSAAQTLALPPGTYLDWLQVSVNDGTGPYTEWTGAIRAAPAPA